MSKNRLLVLTCAGALGFAALPLSIAHAEDFSTDVSARWGRRVVGGNTDPFGTSNIAGSSSATYQNIQDTAVSGGALIVPLPSNDGTNDHATIARDTGVVVNSTFAADNSTYYAGTLLGNLSGKILSVTYKIDIDGKPTGTPLADSDFFGDQLDFQNAGTPSAETRFTFNVRRTGAGAPAENNWVSEAVYIPGRVTSMLDNTYHDYVADLGDLSEWRSLLDGDSATLHPADFAATMANVTDMRFVLGSGFGDNVGFSLAQGTTGSFSVDQFVATSPVPEPASLGLLALGSVGLLARRRPRA